MTKSTVRPRAAELLKAALEESSYTWLPEDPGFFADTEAGRIRAEVRADDAVLRAELVRLCEPSGESVGALRDFLGALNRRLRLARASLSEVSAQLEALIPAGTLTAEMVDEAAGALIVGVRAARKECVALLDPHTARQYLEFHNKSKEKNSHANNDD